MRGRVRAAAAAVTACAVLVATAACSSPSPSGVVDFENVVSIAVAEPGSPITPEFAADPAVARILPAITSGLVRLETTGAPILELAESVETSDNTRFVVSLDPEARFSNGEPLDAASFVEAWRERARSGEALTEPTGFADFLGVAEFVSSVASEDADDVEDAQLDLVESGALEVLDEASFAVTLAEPDASFVRRLAQPLFLPLPESAFQDPDAFDAAPVGAGPYMLAGSEAWVASDRLDLVPNPSYGGTREVENSGISFRFYRTSTIAFAELLAGNVDVVDQLPDRTDGALSSLLNGRVSEAALPVLVSLIPPRASGNLAGEEGVLRRLALAHTIDRAILVRDLLDGAAEPALGFFPVSFGLGEDEDAWTDRANDELARSLWRQANDFSHWEGVLTIAVVAGTPEVRLADELAERFDAVLNLDVQIVAFANAEEVAAALRDDDEPLTAFRLQTTTVETGSLEAALSAAVPRSLTTASIRLRFEQAATAADDERAAVFAVAAQDELWQTVPIIPIWSPTIRAGYAPGVTGVEHEWGAVLDYAAILPAP
ncbi:ABC transporter substrate-binding protein [uncultured Schumannella sp.]|uniref:ABC transporter substrate-binding protein n=1 Tax=uncultured Schumannella sp. TaxID=1195956 RepID=UPI0025DE8375|nr:ABC transporter substrate-binding protein [uncultured Schumannella sp.]